MRWLAIVLAALTWLAGGQLRAEDALERKARDFRDVLLARHVSPEGVLIYEASLSTIEQDLVRGTYPVLSDSPMFTGIWAATSCLQAELGVRPDEARGDAGRALAGLQQLMDVTGVEGLLARSLRRDAGNDLETLRGFWFRGGKGQERFVWRGDVSADQYAHGLVPAVAACSRLFPEQTRRLATAAARHLIAHDMRLVDADGARTRYGDLSPSSGLGFNSIFQLTGYGVIALAADLDPDPMFAAQRDALRDRHRVVARSRTTNLKFFGITNHSNDLMAFHLYRALIPLAQRTNDGTLADLRHGLARAWLRVRDDENPYFAALYCVLEPCACDDRELARARGFLERFPLEKRSVAPTAAYLALPRSWLPGRKGRPLARDLVPIELRPPSTFEWKSSPYRMDYSVAPDLEATGLDFMSAYWMLRAAEQRSIGECAATSSAP